MIRFRCHLWGCAADREPFCYFCGSDLYGDFIQVGVVEQVLAPFRHAQSRLPVMRCYQCRRLLLPWRKRIAGEFCSLQCQTEWIPF